MAELNLALIGCGNFVRGMHLANLMANPRFRIYATVDLDGAAAERMAQTAGAQYASQDAGRVFADPAVDLVFIATPHFTHADLSIRAAQAGKHIFCEKPLALNEADAQAVYAAVRAAGVKYMSGYNRTFAPFTQRAREVLGRLDAPRLIFHRIADWNPYNQGWLLDERLSGGRLLGEAGHALDMICYLAGCDPVRVYAEGGNFAEPSSTGAPDSAMITLGFPNGSSGVLFLSSVGSNRFPKEEVQITCAGHTIDILNFQAMHIYTPSDAIDDSLPGVDKGHKAMLDALAGYILEDQPSPNNLETALRTTRCTLAALRSIRNGQLQHV